MKSTRKFHLFFTICNGSLCIPKATHKDIDMGHLCDLGIIDGVSPEKNDSGGTVFTTPGGARLYGTITGGMDTDDDGIFDIAFYSKVENIYDELDLNVIILDD